MGPITKCFAMIAAVAWMAPGVLNAQEDTKPVAGSTMSGKPTAGSMPPVPPAAGSMTMGKPSAGSLSSGKPTAGSVASGIGGGSLAAPVGSTENMPRARLRRLESTNDGSSYTRTARTPRAKRYQ